MPGVSREEICASTLTAPLCMTGHGGDHRSRRRRQGAEAEYLLRIMQHGSVRARLKLADRISNLTALGFVHDVTFVRQYL